MEIPRSHPRYHSLMTREKLAEAFRKGLVVPEGLIAHGRGECFDYILGEMSRDFALEAERAGVAMLLLADHPVLSVNGNTAGLVAEEICELARIIDAPVEVNIFHWSDERKRKIAEELEKHGVEVYSRNDAVLEGLESARRIVDSRGIYRADVVLVPLEDGDRCEILKRHGKKVVTIDLNPLSRTALMADVTIVDNITRAIPNMIEFAREMKDWDRERLERVVESYDNRSVLRRAILAIRDYLTERAGELE
ncbi:Uncharacterized protein conserved in archaea [Geoglobus ahangari]|uniref:4-phosphopantoate--beta-alanine ligase n=1 Tax=Geoglobus ahangari TaxID=113653 RepID=A0A0F7IHY2_9EURY|nr:4-phosphopantoate--beta-alanine ligase [Geoglobus ahangari]AKG91625.1 Uncharacterized protein conserved in archaea [Geoglobus ahangari]